MVQYVHTVFEFTLLELVMKWKGFLFTEPPPGPSRSGGTRLQSCKDWRKRCKDTPHRIRGHGKYSLYYHYSVPIIHMV